MPLWDNKKAGAFLDFDPDSFYDLRFLQRIGLTPIKVGRSLRFDAEDVKRLAQKGRKELPPQPSGDAVRDV